MAAEYDPGMIEVDIEDALPSPLFIAPTKRVVQYEHRQCRDEEKDISRQKNGSKRSSRPRA